MTGRREETLSSRLKDTRILQDYQTAFAEATGLNVVFQPLGEERGALLGNRFANPFCERLAETQPGCKLCLSMQEKLCAATDAPETHTCLAGLSDTAVPVRAGERILGHLITGQVALKPLSQASFKKVADWLEGGGIEADWQALQAAYFQSPQMSQQQYLAVVRLLEVFSQHVALVAEQIATQQANDEPAQIAKAREYIAAHQDESITLDEVASAVHSSTYHFCRMFKKATGHTFTRYLGLVRVAKAKQLLANPALRISEIALDTGFKSLTHFNRVFREIAGQSPSEFRKSLVQRATRSAVR